MQVVVLNKNYKNNLTQTKKLNKVRYSKDLINYKTSSAEKIKIPPNIVKLDTVILEFSFLPIDSSS